MRSSLIYLLMLIVVLAFGCSSDFSEEAAGDYKILVLSDVHISNDRDKDDRFRKVITMVNSGDLEADMMVITGDCVSSIYWGDRPENHKAVNNRMLKLRLMLEDAEFPYHLVLGNHDYKMDKSKDSDDPFSEEEILAAEKMWYDNLRVRPYYSTEANGWKYIFLNTMRGRYLNRNFDSEQVLWLNDELNTDKPVLIFFHHPIDTDNARIWCKSKDLITPEKEPEFFRLMQANHLKIKGIFVGHGHMWVSDVLYDSIKVFETDSFGDAEEGLTCSVIGIDTVNTSITVASYDEIEFSEVGKN